MPSRRSWSRRPPRAPLSGADSEALLAMPELADVAGRRIAILRGDGGRGEERERGGRLERAPREGHQPVHGPILFGVIQPRG